MKKLSDKLKEIEKICIHPQSSIRQAMRAVDLGSIGVAIAVAPSTNAFIRIFTDGDIRRALLAGHGLESPVSVLDQVTTVVAYQNMPPKDIHALFNERIRVIPLLNEHDEVIDILFKDTRINIPVAEPFLGDLEIKNLTECVASGWISSTGPFVTQFEEIFADFCEVPHAVSASNGTAALHLALLAGDIGPGDEVIVPSLTFIATANAVTYTGATPVFVDSDPVTWAMAPQQVEQLITERTKAIIPVHLYGVPADMSALRKIADKHHLLLIEDAAQAHGARSNGHRVGSLGDMGCFSFFGNKIISTGEGGMIVTKNEDLAKKMRQLRDHGMDVNQRYWHTVLGYNYRLTNLQAAIGVAQMQRADEILDRKYRLAKQYNQGLCGLPGLTLPVHLEDRSNVCWLYSILIDEQQFGLSTAEVIKRLKEQGIDSRPLFIPIHKQPIYLSSQCYPVAEKIAHCGLSLPSGGRMNSERIERVVTAIHKMHRDGCTEDSESTHHRTEEAATQV